ncbi:hypothetical protein FDZ71_06595 [bacterium]|nr:MAG: hypothetical protein FDZ71_06595 [bacterium]
MKVDLFLSGGEPRTIAMGGRSLRIEMTEGSWTGDGFRYFKVICADMARYVLKNNPEDGMWEVILYEKITDRPKEAS